MSLVSSKVSLSYFVNVIHTIESGFVFHNVTELKCIHEVKYQITLPKCVVVSTLIISYVSVIIFLLFLGVTIETSGSVGGYSTYPGLREGCDQPP